MRRNLVKSTALALSVLLTLSVGEHNLFATDSSAIDSQKDLTAETADTAYTEDREEIAETAETTGSVGSKDTQKSEDSLAEVPVLLVSELLPDSTNKNGSDAYEFIEIYNNSDADVNLKDYKLEYVYPASGTVTTWWEGPADKVLGSGDALVFWVKNGSNDDLSIQDFNSHFASNLSEEQLIGLECGGMHNGDIRGIQIATNVGDIVHYVEYNDDVDNTNKDKSIAFQYQNAEGDLRTIMTSDDQTPTPGLVSELEKAEIQSRYNLPEQEPVLTDLTVDGFTNESESLVFQLEAVSPDNTVKTVKLYLKDNMSNDFSVYNLERDENNSFAKSLDNIDILNKKSFSYIFEVSDGANLVRTEEKVVANLDDLSQASFNVSENEILTGEKAIVVHGDKVLLDGKDLSAQTKASINGKAKIVFEVTDTDTFFKNAVAVGEEILGVFDEGSYGESLTYDYDVPAQLIDEESRSLTVEFHAGNKANPLEHNIENNDDFTVRNIRLILANGKTLVPSSHQAKRGLGEVEHQGLDNEELVPLELDSAESNILMGDGKSKWEIVYANFELAREDFDSLGLSLDTTKLKDGEHELSNGEGTIKFFVDNTGPEIKSNIEDEKVYHQAVIEVNVEDNISSDIELVVALDGQEIELPQEIKALEMIPGEHILKIQATDSVGNTSTKEIKFVTPKESGDIAKVSPENGETVENVAVLEIVANDESNDQMTVDFKKGEHYRLGDENISATTGLSSIAGTTVPFEPELNEGSKDGYPYEVFAVELPEDVNEKMLVNLTWTGESNNAKTFIYVFNTATNSWDKVKADLSTVDESLTLSADVILKDHVIDGSLKVLIQNGEGYNPPQFAPGAELAKVKANETEEIAGNTAGENQTGGSDLNIVSKATPTYNIDDTPRAEYDFTFVVESDTQYYNEDYPDNPDKERDGMYQHQVNMNDWIIANRERMNMQYLFHDGDIVDDTPNIPEWDQADQAYKTLEDANFPYGILAGNHDVSHQQEDYSVYSQYFGETRFLSNPWYGGSYKDNRGHYDLISVGGIDFIMVYMGWGVRDEEIDWVNEVLAKYPERKAILNFHEYLLASGGLGEQPQRIHDEIVAKNENVCMVFSGHYHNTKTTVDTFKNEDGSTRKVYNMLFDYQGMKEGGAGYLRLLHFDLEGEKITVRTFTPSHGGNELQNFGDYDANPSEIKNAGNEFIVENAKLNDSEHFTISFSDLGIESKQKTLKTANFEVNLYRDELIGTIEKVQSGQSASYEWAEAKEGINQWYAEVRDENGGLVRSRVYSFDLSKPEDSTNEPTNLTDSTNPTAPNDPTDPTNPSNSTKPTDQVPGQDVDSDETTVKPSGNSEETSGKKAESDQDGQGEVVPDTDNYDEPDGSEDITKTGQTNPTIVVGLIALLTGLTLLAVAILWKKKLQR